MYQVKMTYTKKNAKLSLTLAGVSSEPINVPMDIIDYDLLKERVIRAAHKIKKHNNRNNRKWAARSVVRLGAVVAAAYITHALQLPQGTLPSGGMMVSTLFDLSKEVSAVLPDTLNAASDFMSGASHVVRYVVDEVVKNSVSDLTAQWAAIRNSTLVPMKDYVQRCGIETANFIKDVAKGVLPADREGWVDFARNTGIFLFLYKAEKILDKVSGGLRKPAQDAVQKMDKGTPQAPSNQTKTVITLSEERVSLPDDQDTLGM